MELMVSISSAEAQRFCSLTSLCEFVRCVNDTMHYAKAPFLKPVMGLGLTVVSRLRKDAALRPLPAP